MVNRFRVLITRIRAGIATHGHRRPARYLLLTVALALLPLDGALALDLSRTTSTRLSTSLAANLAPTDRVTIYSSIPSLTSTDPRIAVALDPQILSSTDLSIAALDPRVVLGNPLDSVQVTPVASGPGWSRVRISGIPLPELVVNGVQIPADHFITLQGAQGVANFDLQTITGIYAPPFNDKLKQRLSLDFGRRASADRVYVLYEPALLLALGRDRVASPLLYASLGSQFTYLNAIVDFNMDQLQLNLCGVTVNIYGFDLSANCGGGSGGSGGSGLFDWFGNVAGDVSDWLSSCAPYEEVERPWSTSATARVVDVTTGPFDTLFPITEAYDGTLDFSLHVSSVTDRNTGVHVAASGSVRYGQAFCVPIWFTPTEVRVTADADVEALLALDGKIKSSFSHAFGNGQSDWARFPLFLTTFSIGPVPVIVYFEIVAEFGIEATLASGTQPVQVTGGLLARAGATFDATCDSGGCSATTTPGSSQALQTAPLTSNMTNSGRLIVRPYAWPSARAIVIVGPVPLMGQVGPRLSTTLDVWGQNGLCGDADQDGVQENTVAMTLDVTLPILDLYAVYGLAYIPGLEWAGGLAQGETVLATLFNEHFDFYDLTHQVSNDGATRALSPIISGPTSPRVGVASTYTVRVRPCWPYPDRITGFIYWGDGTAGNWVDGQPITKTWNAPGPYSAVAMPANDAHQRQFAEAPEYRTTFAVSPVADTVPPVISDVSDSPDPFTPSLRQVSTIRFTVADRLSMTCSATVQITSGTLRLAIISSQTVDFFRCRVPTSASVTWNGRDRFGTLVAPGAYTYRITATDDSGNAATATGTIMVR
jgi:hypothetical protein